MMSGEYYVIGIQPSSRGNVQGWEYITISPERVRTVHFHGGNFTREQITKIAHDYADRMSRQYGAKQGRRGPKGRTEAQTKKFQPMGARNNATA